MRLTHVLLTSIFVLAACSEQSSNNASSDPQTTVMTSSPDAVLQDVLAQQPDTVQARYAYRHPLETLSFFGIEPGMTVVEALPSGGWYSKILLQYLGENGHLIGADFDLKLRAILGYNAERLAEFAQWTGQWPVETTAWGVANAASADAFNFGSMPESINGQADAVLFIRALHAMARTSDQGDFLNTALTNAYDALKPGGIVGIVQHSAPADMSAEWASGARGYLHADFVREQMEAIGFEFVASSDINANPKDQPGADDRVWRLPPSLSGTKDDPAKMQAMQAVGESNRFTLKFRKPAA